MKNLETISKLEKKKLGYDRQPLKGYIFFFFNITLILYASLIFTPLTPTDYDLEVGSPRKKSNLKRRGKCAIKIPLAISS